MMGIIGGNESAPSDWPLPSQKEFSLAPAIDASHEQNVTAGERVGVRGTAEPLTPALSPMTKSADDLIAGGEREKSTGPISHTILIQPLITSSTP